MNKQNKFFFISFIPAIAYWYLEANYDLKTALIGGVGLAIVEISFEKIYFKHVHKISLFNFYLILILGSIAFVGNDGIWYKLQPFFTGFFTSMFLFYQKYKKKSFLMETLIEMGKVPPIPAEFMQRMELHLAIFMLSYGSFMAIVAFTMNTDQWLFFKTAGFYLASFIFFGFEMFSMKKKLQNKMEK